MAWHVIRAICIYSFQTKLQIAFTGAVTNMQWRSGVFGSVGEIGVYMGKYSAVLAHNVLPSAGERFFAADIFQKKTKVSAELGRLQTYLSNMARWGFSPNASRDEHVLHLWTDSSIFFSKAVLLRWSVPAVRLLSVDGGHIRPVVINDFMRAACVMREGGVIVFDDAFNTAHPVCSRASRTSLISTAPFLGHWLLLATNSLCAPMAILTFTGSTYMNTCWTSST